MGIDNEDIEHCFGTLVIETCRSFKKREEVSIDEIVLLLGQMSIFGHSMEVIHKAEKMEKLFQSFQDKWSWYNHSLLEDLINDFGDDQDKERFREYHSKFTSFLKNPLPKSQNEYSFGTSCAKGQKLLRIKVNENWDTTTPEQVSQIHHSVARILKVQLRDLYLTSVSKGCICLEFLVPELMTIPLRTSQEEALMAVGVFRLECGEYVFQVYYLTKLSTRNFTDCMLYPSVNFCISYLQLHLPIFFCYLSATLGSWLHGTCRQTWRRQRLWGLLWVRWWKWCWPTQLFTGTAVIVYLLLFQLLLHLFHYVRCQAGKHVRKKSSARKTHGRKTKRSSKLSASTDLMASEVKCNHCCQFVKYEFAWVYVMLLQ